MNSERYPTFKDKGFLINHAKSIMDFYHPICIDKESGGFFHHFRDDGSIYDSSTRHLVSSTRFIFNYSMAFIHFQNEKYIELGTESVF